MAEALAFFSQTRKKIVKGVFPKKKEGANNSISEASTTPSFGYSRDVYFNKKVETCPKWRKPLRFFPRQDKKIETSSNSGGSPGKILTRPAHPPPHTAVLLKGGTTVNNQQLVCSPQGEPTREESLLFDKALEALGESEHHTKCDVFAK